MKKIVYNHISITQKHTGNTMFSINPVDYDLKVELAKCCNNIATVYLAQYRKSGEHVAVKKYRMDKAKEETNQIRDEILAMRDLHHPNILSFHTAFVNNFEVFLVAPLMCYGSCKDTISNCFTTGFPEIIVALILRDVLLGLEYLHKKGYIHRSIRASHILLNQSKAVLTGFRECTSFVSHGERAKSLYNLAPASTKSLNWLAPEVLEQNLLGYTEKSDIYSIGITTCELANGIEPFADMQTTFMLAEKIRGNQPTLLDNSTCPTEDIIAQVGDSGINEQFATQTREIYSHRTFTDAFHKFAEICMSRYPKDRPSSTQLLGHSFFKQCRHATLYEQLNHFGIHAVDYSKLRDESIQVTNEIGDLNINGNFEWDF